MAKKFYAVLKGHKVGIFTTWAACQASTKGYSGAAFKSFTTKEEADVYLGNTSMSPGTSPAKSIQATAATGLTVVLAYQFPIQIYTDGACDPN
ncbi:MAG: RNase H1/viroplasmin domain-containing protein, partial [Sinobacterium sp.]